MLVSFSLFIFFLFFAAALGKKFLKLVRHDPVDLAEDIFFSLGFGFGLVSFLVFILGQLRVFYAPLVIILSLILILFSFREFWHFIDLFFNELFILRKIPALAIKDIYLTALVLLFTLFFIFNLIGALAPELGFDALWFHLEGAKTYLLEHRISFFPPPSQLAQSTVTPRLIDLIYSFLMIFQKTEALPKLFHFGLGLLSALGVYFFARRFFNQRISFIAALMLYSLPWVSWLSRTAYIDLGSLFYSVLFFWAFYLWFLKKERPYFYLAAAMAGLLFAVKLWNIILLPPLLIFILYRERWRLKRGLSFLVVTLIPVLPFYIEAFIYTKNPFYPVFSWWDKEHSGGAKNTLDWLFNIHPKTFLITLYDDFFLQTFFLLFALVLFLFPSALKKILPFFLAGILFVVTWSYIPVHEYRYVLPALPPLVLVSAFAFEFLKKQNFVLKYFLELIFLIFILFNLTFIFKQNKPYFAVALGKESRHQFLSRHLGGDIWTFYDTDGYFKQNIKKQDRVLVLAHNMFYINFPYLDGWRLGEELAKIESKDDFLNLLKKENFTHILLKSQVHNWNSFFDLTKIKVSLDDPWLEKHFRLIYSNNFTGVVLFEIMY